MNIRILVPRRTRGNPNWLTRCARCIGRLRTLHRDFNYFRRRGMTVRAAFWNARNTINSPTRMMELAGSGPGKPR